MKKRFKYITVSPEFFVECIKGRTTRDTNLPDDAKFIRMYPEQHGAVYHMVLHSSEWDILEEGESIPQFVVE